ncbi:MAG: Holliday junction branch migration protein RuvA [Candidatus Baltobacteraceae bacterium]|jgi:Holliday junction DNA helicase RuvA
MFSRITGTIAEFGESSVLLEAGGLAYEIVLPPCVAEKLPRALGERVTLDIYPAFNLDGNSGRFTFFGFTNAIERAFFEALISVASIGPKTAARAFSQPMGRIAKAIDAGDYAFLVKLPGIGQQKARDIVAKLQGKVTRFLLIQDAEPRAAEPIPDFAEEALAVLLQLEYKRSEAETMLAETLAAAPHLRDAETLLAEIYRVKNRRAEAS